MILGKDLVSDCIMTVTTALQFVAYRFHTEHPRCLASFDCDMFVLTCLVDESADHYLGDKLAGWSRRVLIYSLMCCDVKDGFDVST